MSSLSLATWFACIRKQIWRTRSTQPRLMLGHVGSQIPTGVYMTLEEMRLSIARLWQLLTVTKSFLSSPTMKILWSKVKSRSLTREDVTSWLVGNARLYFYNKDSSLLPDHIVQQFEWRQDQVPKECLNGACKVCGCSTPGLFMADKSCEANCYPPMMSRKKWNEYVQECRFGGC